MNQGNLQRTKAPMAKRTKAAGTYVRRTKADWPRVRPPSTPPEWLSKHHAREMTPPKLDDFAFWIEWDEHPSDWVEAIYAFDDRGDKTDLLSLLRSDRELKSTDREHLRNLIERYQFKRTRPAEFLRSLDEIEKREEADAEPALRAALRGRRDPVAAAHHYVARLSFVDDLSPGERRILADLFECHDVVKKKHRPRTPSYTMPLKELFLERAVKEMRELVKRGKSVEEASMLARGDLIPEDDGKGHDPLRDAYEGRRASYRRALRNRRPLVKLA
jgi:hypothetical protein